MSAGAHVSPLRGTAPTLRRAAPDAGAPKPHVLRPTGPLLPFVFARGATFLALATFGALHWMAMLDPTAAERAWYAVGGGLLAMGGLLGAARLRGALRRLAVAATIVLVSALAFLAAGVPDELLRPDNWDALAAGIERGISALPGARVPYRGIDEWTRIVIPLGGTVLTALAGIAAFWPRRASTGFPFAALVLLVGLYAVPAVALDFDGEFVRGALLALLIVAFLRLERLRLTEAGGAAGLAAGMAIAALLVAPALDGDTPWWDYETWALSTAASRSTTFSWDHDYGPLDWPRDGREMLRVKAKQAAYWKAQSLDVFDGERWRQSRTGSSEAIRFELPTSPVVRRRFTQEIEVSVRNLRSRTFITAGIATDAPAMPNRAAIPTGPPGIWASSRTLRRGDSYKVSVYTPKPNERELRAAGSYYDRDFSDFRSIDLIDRDLSRRAGEPPGPVPLEVEFPEWNSREAPEVIRPGAGEDDPIERPNGDRTMERSDLRRTWALSKELRRDAPEPLDYVESVEAYLGRGFTYTEAPPPKAQTIEGFLFDAKSGYCQQYSGAMATLLRMAGIPARVATGFTSGSYDRKAKEYVVRDLDAHSWVEVWFPEYGWVTYDPTPSAAPPRSQSGDRAGPALGAAPDLGGADTTGASSGTTAEEGTPWTHYAAGGVLAALLLGGGVFAFRRRGRRPAPLPELERALRRTRRAPGPGATLQALEASFARSPDAAGYVRALRDQRYGARGEAPTSAQRRGLRSELGRGGGLLGRLRAWWALPPRRSSGQRRIDAHG
ncbi:MAG TPA: transglutaminaseTgpA domain-containing protein [Solirubrobacteraceae bacterium]|nr:transglutaminaseTgpA domain-containing protein [Solirubrobacteraceae bacterium]